MGKSTPATRAAYVGSGHCEETPVPPPDVDALDGDVFGLAGDLLNGSDWFETEL